MVHLRRGIPLVEQKSASELSVFSLHRDHQEISALLSSLPTWDNAPKGRSFENTWLVCVLTSEALVSSRYCRASRAASDAKYFIKVFGVTLYPRVPDFIKFFLLQLLVLFSNWRVRNSLGVSLLQRVFVHHIYVGPVQVWQELKSCIQVTVTLLVMRLYIPATRYNFSGLFGLQYHKLRCDFIQTL